MAFLATLHRWAGATIGLILIVMGLSGIALIWEGEWIGLPGADDPVIDTPSSLAQAVETASAHREGLNRITFASDELSLHQAAYSDGSGAYFDQSGAIVDQWGSVWGRPELWIFDLHHYLFAGEAGEIVVGVAGIAGVLFIVSGAILWWRTRRTFSFRLWPKRMSRSAIVRQHRDLGIVMAPVLFLTMLTGSAMIFEPVSAAIVAPLPERSSLSRTLDARLAQDDMSGFFDIARRNFPNAEIRRLQLSDEGATLRLRQPFEWTPNGRTYVRIERSGKIIIEAPDGTFDKQSVSEKFYPIHSGKVGGLAWKVVLTMTGLSLVILGALASLSFWTLRSNKR
ncbi:PepSY-associated TM helix domain-containing protein [Croceicoccus bisphenolivorans]|uniref:PepSY-associated TM helix domain-containing protein n=1 Tax=Croceicoccus bisphenolivorans TaxID=1783232 RepID=UPI00082D66C2|nr:PepSY-associated TM helix domain-containing protein [Croceicoccus bisphenolivorans]